MKKRICFVVLLLILPVFLFCCLRHVGLPEEILSAISRTSGVPRSLIGFLEQTVGSRRTCKMNNGIVLWREIYRGKRIPVGLCMSRIPLVKGDYYDVDGGLVSTVRNGSGVKVIYRADGIPETVEVYKNGNLRGPCLWWTPDGSIKDCFLLDDEGLLHGMSMNFYSNGLRKVRCKYDRGQRTGMFESWYESGSTNSQVFYINGNRQWSALYDTVGVLTQCWSITSQQKTNAISEP